ncbi:uncharacterized protein BP5553_09760 [Venustampulla echinocandica]|uniref:Uncharacterized protein n=1 Tax=Venustampulla echinocandica TaxID=2656787 RepID=A0A370TBW9_9HELO|nr:uncharacterized protein BP5553_09760 [Venustampulla echinocandica]RDL31551.1 hypothetical protein BP5553_09760 [Venustampulla echinocandica]
MGASDRALAWKNKQDKPEDYDVFGPYPYDGGPVDGPLSAAVFIEKGQGNITVGGACHYAAMGDWEWEGGSLEWTAEGGAIVAYVVKKI